MDSKFKGIAILAIIAIVLMLAFQIGGQSKAVSDYNSGKPGDKIITVTDKQIIVDYSSNNGNGSTSRDFVVFTENGAYLCGGVYNEASVYGQMQVGHKYEVWTSASFSMSYEASIIKVKEIK